MPVINRIADYAEDLTAWRRHLHQYPELGFECHETAAFVAERLREFGVDELHEGIAKTGIVAIINGQGDGPTIGLRADMDALPLEEATGVPYASKVPGKMHACGHDGHTTMLLGAARYLAETRNFAGRVALVFQPAEEDGGGGDIMVQEGVVEKFGISDIYALHTTARTEAGKFRTTAGPLMAAVDTVTIDVIGKGGHGAYPEKAVDPIAAAVNICNALQTIVSRNKKGTDDLIVSVTQFHSGTASNIVPEEAFLQATVRTFDPHVRDMVERRVREICDGHALSFNVEVKLDYERGYPALLNTADETVKAVAAARDVAGEANVDDNSLRDMGAEDFSYFLEKIPGCYLYIGQGIGPGVHDPRFNFNDEVTPVGASFFARLVERLQPAIRD